MNEDDIAIQGIQTLEANRFELVLIEIKPALSYVKAAASTRDRGTAARYLYNALIAHDTAIDFMISDAEIAAPRRAQLAVALIDLNRQIARVMQLMLRGEATK